jgi:hypothetical protein
MTASKHVTLWCDEPHCNQLLEVGSDSKVEEARKSARITDGWRSTKGGKDFCSQHRLTASGKVRR